MGKKQAIIISLFLFIIMACGDNLPIREMTHARNTITEAEKVQASKYAPKEYEAARAKLFECHQFIVEENIDKATDSAKESKRLAQLAYIKAAPLLAKDSLEEARISIDSSNDAYAEKLAANEYLKAKSEFESANTLFENHKYYKSHLKAQAAILSARDARTVAISKKSFLKESITEVNHTLEVAKEYGALKYAEEKYNLANENITIAEESYKTHELRKGFNAIEVAKMNADDAYLVSIEQSAKQQLVKAEMAIDNAQKAPTAIFAKDEISAAKESYGNAKSSLTEQKYKESIDSSDEAIRLATVALGMKASDGSNVSLSGNGTVGESSEYTVYVVKFRKRNKDCLWRISKQFYKNPRLWRKIYNANKEQVRNPNLIRPGWTLKIPR